MRIFNYDNFQLRLNLPELLLVPEFKEVIEKDKTKDKKHAFGIFTYMFLVYDWKSPFSDYTEEEKRLESIKASGIDESVIEEEHITAVCEKYKEIMDSNLTLSLLRDMKDSISKFRQYFREVDFTKKVENGAQKGTMLFKPKEYLDVMKRSNEIFEGVELLEKKLVEQLSEDDIKVRGDRQIARDID